MRFAVVASLLVAAISLVTGSFLIDFGTAQWIAGASSLGFFGMLLVAGLGGLLTFLALPVALFGFDKLPKWAVDSSRPSDEMTQDEDQSLFSNKRIMGLSLVITGADWLIFSIFALQTYVSYILFAVGSCPMYGCPSILSSLAIWVLIGIGVLILATGIVLIMMSKNEEHPARQERVRASLASSILRT